MLAFVIFFFFVIFCFNIIFFFVRIFTISNEPFQNVNDVDVYKIFAQSLRIQYEYLSKYKTIVVLPLFLSFTLFHSFSLGVSFFGVGLVLIT